jgi:hypothetical protein
MTVEENAAQYRYWGLEIRIVFVLIAVIFLLVAIFSFFHDSTRGLIYLVIAIIVVTLVRLDYNHHLISLDDKRITFKKIKWDKIRTQSLTLNWSDVKNVSTRRFGFFDLWNKTKVTSKAGQTISAFSFMEDYFHFLKDIVRSSKNAEIDKLTQDLIAGRADL